VGGVVFSAPPHFHGFCAADTPLAVENAPSVSFPVHPAKRFAPEEDKQRSMRFARTRFQVLNGWHGVKNSI
jgi:hypothetical protein